MKIGAFPVPNPPNYYTKFEKKQTKTVGGGGFNDPGPKPKYPQLCQGIQ
jgi:hypothetical protein